MAIFGGHKLKAHQVDIQIQRDKDGEMVAASLNFANRLYVPSFFENGIAMPEIQATSVHISQATPEQQMKLASILSEIYESQVNLSQIAGATAEPIG